MVEAHSKSKKFKISRRIIQRKICIGDAYCLSCIVWPIWSMIFHCDSNHSNRVQMFAIVRFLCRPSDCRWYDSIEL